MRAATSLQMAKECCQVGESVQMDPQQRSVGLVLIEWHFYKQISLVTTPNMLMALLLAKGMCFRWSFDLSCLLLINDVILL